MAGERVLVVDDERQIVRLCTQALGEQGYAVEGENGGQQAMARLETSNFDLLVVDVKMPDMDGLTLLRQARALDPNLTAIVITGYATLDRTIEALQSGARRFLLKPFGFADLISAVESALTQREREQEALRLRAQLPILEISQALLAKGDVDSLARRLLDVVVRQIKAPRAMILLLDQESEELYVAATAGIPPPAQGRRPCSDPDLADKALQADEPLVLDSQSRTDLPPLLQPLAPESAGGLLVLVPLRTPKAGIGLLGLGWPEIATARSRAPITSGDLDLLSIMAGQIAIGLENARLYALEQQRIAALARALDQQQELDRLKNEFMRNVSHELRTPLTMIMGYVELLDSGELGELLPSQQGPVSTLVSQTLALYQLVDNITALLQNETRERLRDLFSMEELLRTALYDFQVLADRSGLALEAEITATETNVRGDSRHLRRVLDNLIDNALKFTPEGGSITVGLHNRAQQVVVQIQDTGIGIGQEHLERIFDRFYQVDGSIQRHHDGSGLGLALVKEIVASHGGTVAVESEEGVGSQFIVSLPLASPLPEEGKDAC
jgi:signal transduction histidine kinase/DNA-binding response OmpR family regulator